jgi:hypothetical protein
MLILILLPNFNLGATSSRKPPLLQDWISCFVHAFKETWALFAVMLSDMVI